MSSVRRSWGGRRGTWASNVQRATLTVTGRDQVAEGVVGAIDRDAGRSMAGRSGRVYAGMGPGYRFNGYLAYDTLAMTRMVPSTTNLRGSPNVALPATGGVIIEPGSPMDSLAALPVLPRR